MKKYFKDYIFLFSLAGAIVALDQWTKYLVRQNLPFQAIWSPWPWLTPFARIVHWKNTGAAFGIFQGFGDVFTILAIVVSIAILYYFPQVPRRDWTLRLAMGMQLGGAVGNLIDRLFFGSVTDFVSVGNFAVFNVADASISIGVAILILGMLAKERQDYLEERDRLRNEGSPQSPDESGNLNKMDETPASKSPLTEEVRSE
ncbi:MAG: signal peptidase II [Anaerolineales bacterium]